MSELIPEKYREDEEIIRLTIDQLSKDFGSHFPVLHFSGRKENLFDELAFQLSETLRTVRKMKPGAFMSILYRVDIRESEVPDLSQEDAFYLLSEKIVKREFQKVLTRRLFRP